MFYVFDSPNPAAPVYDPALWNEGVVQAQKLPKVVKTFCESAGIPAPEGVSDKVFLRCFDLVNRVKLGKAELTDHKRALIEQSLNVPLEAVSVLHDSVQSHLNFAVFKNCYAYSRDDQDMSVSMFSSAMPGERAGSLFPTRQVKSYSRSEYRRFLVDACEKDGLEYIGLEPRRSEGFYLTALFVAISSIMDEKDFHFVREDRDGKFSHKMGSGFVNRLDDYDRPIMDPADARFYFYETEYSFEGYFLNQAKPSF